MDPIVEFNAEFESGMLSTCGIVVCEVLRGIRDIDVFRRMESFFGLIHTVQFDAKLWKLSYQLAWELDRKGDVLPLSDILIASAAISENLVLVTTDGHFKYVPGLVIQEAL